MGKEPDYLIEGKYWDCYAPSRPSARNVASEIKEDKVQTEQATRIVLNLDDTPVTTIEMRQQLTDYPIPGLDEVLTIKRRHRHAYLSLMAIYYSLGMDSPVTATEARRLVAQAIGAPQVGDEDGLDPQSANLQVSVTDTLAHSWQAMIQEFFDFRPSLYVQFRVRNDAETEARDRELIRATSALLATGPGDAVLLNNGENVVLQRPGGKLEVNAHWFPEDYAPTSLLAVPHASRLIAADFT
jgi:hypothetical protein